MEELYNCCPYYMEIKSEKIYAEVVKLNLTPISVLIIITNNVNDVLSTKKIFCTQNYRITTNEMTSEELAKCVDTVVSMKLDVILSVVYKKYLDKKNLQVLLYPSSFT